ncbi:hypothetical protein K440DRAFT_619362 [Wilcoxina mikolae CBS 423.85]|nr:hypothetical protein K440DRAFT_619362 [Wilcoxina mikolae CBS 423.85]
MRTLSLPFVAVLAMIAIDHVSAVPTDLSPVRRDASDANLLLERSEGHLEKRDCIYNGCTCRPSIQGQYCWNCGPPNWNVQNSGDTSVWPGSYTDWVFECNPNGGCCTYGYRTSCAQTSGTNPCG